MTTSYFEQLRDPRWQRKRLEIMGRDDFTCRLCGEREATLNVHHLYYTKGALPWEYEDSSLLTVCGQCHEFLHEYRFGESLLESMIVGRADWEALSAMAEMFQITFRDGPEESQARLSKEQWLDLIRGIDELIHCLRDGLPPAEIGKRVAHEIEWWRNRR